MIHSGYVDAIWLVCDVGLSTKIAVGPQTAILEKGCIP